MRNNKKLAFSLPELGITFIVLGVLLTTVISASKMISSSRIVTAKALTNSAPVLGTEGLTLWFEALTKESFLKGEMVNGGAISQWNDVSESSTDHSVAQSNPAVRPIYTENVLNKLPALKFNGSGYGFLKSNVSGYKLVDPGREFTLFMVAQNEVTTSSLAFYLNASERISVQIPNSATASVIFDSPNSGGRVESAVSSISQIRDGLKPAIWSFIRNGSNGFIYYDGAPIVTSSSLTSYVNLTSSMSLQIGLDFNGFIGEVILYKRALSDSEREAIEGYLSQKWRISLL